MVINIMSSCGLRCIVWLLTLCHPVDCAVLYGYNIVILWTALYCMVINIMSSCELRCALGLLTLRHPVDCAVLYGY